MRSSPLRGLIVAAALTLPLSLVTNAHAVHLFPLTPDFDPLGHDCAQVLEGSPENAASSVTVVGFNFIDGNTLTTTTQIAPGESVTWTWLLDHCHSVTFEALDLGTQGEDGFQPAEPELVRMDGAENDSFTLTFDEPGVYPYICVHHAAVGMVGTVVVSQAY